VDGGSAGFVREIVNLFLVDVDRIMGIIAGLVSVPSPTPHLWFYCLDLKY
jgi:hypothetical protein